MKNNLLLIYYLQLFLFFSCNDSVNYYDIPAFSSNSTLNAVIEIPAGTNKKFEYSVDTGLFKIDKNDGRDRIISFLPYLGNYGFVPSTYSDPTSGGDGDPLDILVLSDSIKTGAIVEVKPLGVLKLIDNGEIDYKIIAIPVNKENQTINATNYNEFTRDFPQIKTIIEIWFLNYNKFDQAELRGWGSEKEVFDEVQKSMNYYQRKF